MNFFNDEIHQDMVDMYRDFAQNSCGPIAEIPRRAYPCDG